MNHISVSSTSHEFLGHTRHKVCPVRPHRLCINQERASDHSKRSSSDDRYRADHDDVPLSGGGRDGKEGAATAVEAGIDVAKVDITRDDEVKQPGAPLNDKGYGQTKPLLLAKGRVRRLTVSILDSLARCRVFGHASHGHSTGLCLRGVGGKILRNKLDRKGGNMSNRRFPVRRAKQAPPDTPRHQQH